jgi:hypothetical protein
LLEKFRAKREVQFSDVFDKKDGRYGLIGTLIALLEMMKQGYLNAFQDNCFDDIRLAYTGSHEVTADLILAGITAEEMREDQEKARKAAAEAEAAAAGEGGDPASIVDEPVGDDPEAEQAETELAGDATSDPEDSATNGEATA